MDFREVWKNTNTLAEPQVEPLTTASDREWRLTMTIFLVALFMLLVNILTFMFFYRKTIMKKIRSSCRGLSQLDASSVSYYPGIPLSVYEERMSNLEAEQQHHTNVVML